MLLISWKLASDAMTFVESLVASVSFDGMPTCSTTSERDMTLIWKATSYLPCIETIIMQKKQISLASFPNAIQNGKISSNPDEPFTRIPASIVDATEAASPENKFATEQDRNTPSLANQGAGPTGIHKALEPLPKERDGRIGTRHLQDPRSWGVSVGRTRSSVGDGRRIDL